MNVESLATCEEDEEHLRIQEYCSKPKNSATPRCACMLAGDLFNQQVCKSNTNADYAENVWRPGFSNYREKVARLDTWLRSGNGEIWQKKNFQRTDEEREFYNWMINNGFSDTMNKSGISDLCLNRAISHESMGAPVGWNCQNLYPGICKSGGCSYFKTGNDEDSTYGSCDNNNWCGCGWSGCPDGDSCEWNRLYLCKLNDTGIDNIKRVWEESREEDGDPGYCTRVQIESSDSSETNRFPGNQCDKFHDNLPYPEQYYNQVVSPGIECCSNVVNVNEVNNANLENINQSCDMSTLIQEALDEEAESENVIEEAESENVIEESVTTNLNIGNEPEDDDGSGSDDGSGGSSSSSRCRASIRSIITFAF